MTDIKVTQADKEACAKFVSPTSYYIGDGNKYGDTLPLVQAFARHRIEAQRPLLEALEMALPWIGKIPVGMPSVESSSDAFSSVQSAIKQAKGE